MSFEQIIMFLCFFHKPSVLLFFAYWINESLQTQHKSPKSINPHSKLYNANFQFQPSASIYFKFYLSASRSILHFMFQQYWYHFGTLVTTQLLFLLCSSYHCYQEHVQLTMFTQIMISLDAASVGEVSWDVSEHEHEQLTCSKKGRETVYDIVLRAYIGYMWEMTVV